MNSAKEAKVFKISVDVDKVRVEDADSESNEVRSEGFTLEED